MRTGYVKAGDLQDISGPNTKTNLGVLLTRRPELNAHIADARLYITQRLNLLAPELFCLISAHLVYKM